MVCFEMDWAVVLWFLGLLKGQLKYTKYFSSVVFFLRNNYCFLQHVVITG